MSAYITYLQAVVETTLRRAGLEIYDDEDGALAVEAAVLIAVLVAMAVAAGFILMAKMRSNAEAIPDVANIPSS